MGPDIASGRILKNDKKLLVFLDLLRSGSLQRGANLASFHPKVSLSQHVTKVNDFEMILRGFEMILRGCEMVLRGFEMILRGFEMILRRF